MPVADDATVPPGGGLTITVTYTAAEGAAPETYTEVTGYNVTPRGTLEIHGKAPDGKRKTTIIPLAVVRKIEVESSGSVS